MLALYGAIYAPFRSTADRQATALHYAVRPQGNDSNCDFIAAANGVQAIGGNGEEAYLRSRQLVAQGPFDYREGFYTLYGPAGSDQPFSLNNLGAAPEAFIGVYEALGYNATLLAAPPGAPDATFARAIRDQLLRAPGMAFAHLWITPHTYNPRARLLTVAATGEQAPLLYPYHEVAAVIDPLAPDRVIILDGLIGYPIAIDLDRLAYQLRGFNKAIVVQRSEAGSSDHLVAQIASTTQPYAVVGLGGAFLTMARQTWESAYPTWGRVIGPPLRMHHGDEIVVRLPGEYVLYERSSAGGVGLAQLGVWMRDGLVAQGLIEPERLRPAPLHNALREWVVVQFGSGERFHAIYGAPLTEEIWLTPEMLRGAVLRGSDHPLAHESASGYIIVITERALLVWSPEHGSGLAPLGRIFYQELRTSLGQ
jgi:hypothetical protein